jgi:hypothetical protein
MIDFQCERETAILAKSNCQSEMKEKSEQEIKNKITYESAVKHACCSPKEKCVIF